MLFTATLLLFTTEARLAETLAQALGLKADVTCPLYAKTQYGECMQNGCGACKNPGGRTGVLCGGQNVGYYCSPEGTDDSEDGNNVAFACMDWTFGSTSMRGAETNFKTATGEDVFFGVGTYGTSSDKLRGLGACYRMKIDGVEKDILVQSINTGSDVQGNQFDLQMGDGGAGAFNNCAGKPWSMFPGPYSADTWGKIYGGASTRSQCSDLPQYPQDSAAMKKAGDDLQTLCQYSFDQKVRGATGQNPTITDLARVQCPSQLTEFTQLRRSDDPSGYKITAANRPAGFPNTSTCGANPQSLNFCLTRMMDCRKPSGGFIDNVDESLTVDGFRVVQPCTSDGYTRIDVQCGCMDCYC